MELSEPPSMLKTSAKMTAHLEVTALCGKPGARQACGVALGGDAGAALIRNSRGTTWALGGYG